MTGLAAGRTTIGVSELVEVRSFLGERVPVKAKIDTGAYYTSMDMDLAKQLGLLRPENIVRERRFRSALGEQIRPLVDLTFWLGGKKIKTIASVTDRSKLSKPMIVGRSDLKGFLINP